MERVVSEVQEAEVVEEVLRQEPLPQATMVQGIPEELEEREEQHRREGEQVEREEPLVFPRMA